MKGPLSEKFVGLWNESLPIDRQEELKLYLCNLPAISVLRICASCSPKDGTQYRTVPGKIDHHVIGHSLSIRKLTSLHKQFPIAQELREGHRNPRPQDPNATGLEHAHSHTNCFRHQDPEIHYTKSVSPGPRTPSATMSDQIRELAEIPRDFLREGTLFLNRCTKRTISSP